MSVGGKAADQKCVFPFRYKGEVYYACTWHLSHLTKGAWCSTETDFNGEHVLGKWGLCSDDCPIPPKG